MNHDGTRDLQWWSMREWVPAAPRIIAASLAVGLVAGLTYELAAGLVFGLAYGFAGLLAGLLQDGFAFGLVAGLAEAFSRPDADNASRLSLLTSWRRNRRAYALLVALVIGLAFVLGYGLVIGLAVVLRYGLVSTLVLGSVLGLAVRVAAGFGGVGPQAEGASTVASGVPPLIARDRARGRCYRPRYLNIQRLNYLWTIRHSSATIAGNLIT